MKLIYTIASIVLIHINCLSQQIEEPEKPLFENYVTLGTTNSKLNEISGMVASLNNPGFFWVHNDSGDEPKVYLVNKDMQILLTVFLEFGVYYENVVEDSGNKTKIKHIEAIKSIDWEDITMYTKENENYIVVGDIGDNSGQRSSIALYCFKEPVLNGMSNISISAEKMTLNYAEGARDAEALMFDPISDKMIILTKRDVKSKIYAFTFKPEKTIINSIGTLDLRLYVNDDEQTNKITAGDIDKYGNIILKNYSHVFLLKNPYKNQATDVLLNSFPLKLNYIVEPQGESLCWGLDLISFYTVSENRYGNLQPLYKYY